jgi:hypothetical protein
MARASFSTRRCGQVRLWQNDAEVNPSFFATHLYVVANATPDGWTASMAMTRAVEPWPCEWAVSAADVDKLLRSKPGLPRRRPGPVTTHDWHAIDGEIARRCINPKNRQVAVPKNENKPATDMLEWCSTTFDREPAESEMREAVKRICAALRPV